ncbi:MAG: energy-coupling factor transporter ATPase [Chloroflexota bacterium]|nr:energy-coupling factor transporter ATPase [Chloroflexota bacterium]
MTSDPLIRAVDVHYTYDEGSHTVEALRGVDLCIDEGDFVALVGHNGSGKSTLAKCLNALLLPTQGDVWVKGQNTRHCSESALLEIRATVGMVFQHPENQFVATTVREEVAFGPENLGVPEPELHRRVECALQDVGLESVKGRNPHDLSTGQKSRLAIAGILAMEPECLILDESTAMLDPIARRNVLALLDDLHRRGLTLILITHSMEEAVLADRIVVLDEGRVALEGSPSRVFADHAVFDDLGLDLTVSAAIARGLQHRGLDLSGETILTQDDLVNALAKFARVRT